MKRRNSLGLFPHSDTEERFTQSLEEIPALIQIAIGGLVAEELWFEEASAVPACDLAAAATNGAQMIGPSAWATPSSRSPRPGTATWRGP